MPTKFCSAAAWAIGTGLCLASPALATESGTIAYPIGVNTIMAGALPAPGDTWWQNYMVYYTANSFVGGDGRSMVPGFNADIAINAARFLHTWDAMIGPFTLTSSLVVPVLNSEVGTVAGTESNFDVGDITITPLYLGWSTPDRSFFGYTGVDIFVPTGTAVSSNYYSFDAIVAATWLPHPKLEISGTVGIEFHTENDTTDYQSGTLFFADLGVNYHAFDAIPPLAIGIGGYIIQQIGDDEVRGVTYLDGSRQQVFAVGPQISYGTEKGGFALKWQHEFAAENRPEGERYWFQFMVPLKAP